MEQLDQIKARAEAATPGPWVSDSETRGDCVVWGPDGRFLMNQQAEPHWREYPGEKRAVSFDVDQRDGEFIAHAREDVPRLIDALEAVLERCEHIDRSKPVGDWYYNEITGAINRALGAS